MRVDRPEVELAGDQEDGGCDGVEAREAAGAMLGGLEQSAEGFKDAVGMTGLCPRDDALCNDSRDEKAAAIKMRKPEP